MRLRAWCHGLDTCDQAHGTRPEAQGSCNTDDATELSAVLKTLDRYIIRQFLGTFFFILVLIMAVAVVFDISERTEDFHKSTATLHEIVFDYYVNFVIYYANFFSGLLIFLAVLLFTSRLAGRTEVIAMLSSGVSFPRFIRPYFIAATILTGISLYVNVFLLPAANRTKSSAHHCPGPTKSPQRCQQ